MLQLPRVGSSPVKTEPPQIVVVVVVVVLLLLCVVVVAVVVAVDTVESPVFCTGCTVRKRLCYTTGSPHTRKKN